MANGANEHTDTRATSVNEQLGKRARSRTNVTHSLRVNSSVLSVSMRFLSSLVLLCHAKKKEEETFVVISNNHDKESFQLKSLYGSFYKLGIFL